MTPEERDAVAGVRILAEVMERGLNRLGFVEEAAMMIKRQDVADLRTVLALVERNER